MIGVFATAVLLLGLAFAAYRWWRRRVHRELEIGAASTYQRYLSSEPDFLSGITEARFADIYCHALEPRLPGYILAITVLFVLGSPLVLGTLAGLAALAAATGMVPQPGDVAMDLHLNAQGASLVRRFSPDTLAYIVQGWSGFYYFFGLLAYWIALSALLMRRYHRRSSGSLRAAVRRARTAPPVDATPE
ncbi:hypothetical protein PB2503_04652 [Parvularcula bermudensis HTCC2503]|uniref:Uncharacterized protein n=1 Tax=Parvularcula bermudensis (strain ATCC BAA-594 / HTCC2503 / KCTC 12087) TaxID=314260 RepID=E0TF87_PARBH|nr:hypothetical protein [Parvularcula bermudensis]ADM09005.1 hypothetical protein PB2503_04652 [Parvularcula bermudensis HTCC2503]